jgi:hypothetical protein
MGCTARKGAAMRRRNQTALEKELSEIHALLREHHRWHRTRCAEAIDGPHGALVEQLVEILDKLELSDGKHLIDFVHSQNWCGVDPDTRFLCLHAIDGAIIKLREQAGMITFSDPLEGQPANVFLTVKHLLMV